MESIWVHKRRFGRIKRRIPDFYFFTLLGLSSECLRRALDLRDRNARFAPPIYVHFTFTSAQRLPPQLPQVHVGSGSNALLVDGVPLQPQVALPLHNGHQRLRDPLRKHAAPAPPALLVRRALQDPHHGFPAPLLEAQGHRDLECHASARRAAEGADAQEGRYGVDSECEVENRIEREVSGWWVAWHQSARRAKIRRAGSA
jgi:hypothetical protein